MKKKELLIELISICFVIVLGGLLLMVACTKSTAAPAPGPTSAPKTAPAPIPKKPSGTLTLLYTTLYSEDWLPWTGAGARLSYTQAVMDHLVDINLNTRDPIPGLATGWKVSADGKTWTFNIRKGVQFHDGWGELTAEDVKFSIEGHLSEGAVSSESEVFKKIVDSIKVVDPYKLEIKLKEPSNILLDSLAAGQQTTIVCKKYMEQKGADYVNKHPIGTGPWRLLEQGPGEFMKFKAVERHWRKTPEFEHLVIRKVVEESTRVSMLKTGQADIIMISHESIPEIKKTKELKLLGMIGAYGNSIVFGGMHEPGDNRYQTGYHRSDPWADIRVRKAMDLAIDKRAIIQELYRGYARPTAVAPFIYPGWQDFPPHPYDPVQAKKLLAEAGYPQGFEVVINAFPHPPASEQPTIAQIVAMYWEKIGLKTKIIPTEWASLRPSVIKGQTAHCVFPFRLGVESWERYSDTYYHKDGNLAIYQDPVLDKLLERTLTEGIGNQKKRTALMKDFGKIISDHFGTIPLAIVDEVWAAGPRVKGWDLKVGSYSKYLSHVHHSEERP